MDHSEERLSKTDNSEREGSQTPTAGRKSKGKDHSSEKPVRATNILPASPSNGQCDSNANFGIVRMENIPIPTFGRKDEATDLSDQQPVAAGSTIPPEIDYASAGNEIDDVVYLAYAFPHPRRARQPNYKKPDYSMYPKNTFHAKVMSWDRKSGCGKLFEPRSGATIPISIMDIRPDYGALIVGTEVYYEMWDGDFVKFWVDHDRYYVSYREAAICETRYPYMRLENDDIDYDPARDYFRRPKLDDLDLNSHMQIYETKYKD